MWRQNQLLLIAICFIYIPRINILFWSEQQACELVGDVYNIASSAPLLGQCLSSRHPSHFSRQTLSLSSCHEMWEPPTTWHILSATTLSRTDMFGLYKSNTHGTLAACAGSGSEFYQLQDNTHVHSPIIVNENYLPNGSWFNSQDSSTLAKWSERSDTSILGTVAWHTNLHIHHKSWPWDE